MSQVVTNSPSAPAQSNTLAIYLLVGKEKPNLKDNVLESTPVLADGDFVSFDLKTQTFTIKAEAAKRLCRKLQEKIPYPVAERFDWPVTPFVWEALGEQIYVGMFSTHASSSKYFGKPVVKPVTVFFPLWATNDVTFDSEFIGYGANMEPVLDPRGDKRIVDAVEKLSKRGGMTTGKQSYSKREGQLY
jgi:hypothetical protein